MVGESVFCFHSFVSLLVIKLNRRNNVTILLPIVKLERKTSASLPVCSFYWPTRRTGYICTRWNFHCLFSSAARTFFFLLPIQFSPSCTLPGRTTGEVMERWNSSWCQRDVGVPKIFHINSINVRVIGRKWNQERRNRLFSMYYSIPEIPALTSIQQAYFLSFVVFFLM